jgi:hypothetical protein
MTSNVGSQLPRGWPTGARDKVMAELRRAFRPEFLNRIDDIVVFHRLGRNEIDSIVDLQFARLRKLLRERGPGLELTPEARTWLGDAATTPLRRAAAQARHDAPRPGPAGEAPARRRVPSGRHHRHRRAATGSDALSMEREAGRRSPPCHDDDTRR